MKTLARNDIKPIDGKPVGWPVDITGIVGALIMLLLCDACPFHLLLKTAAPGFVVMLGLTPYEPGMKDSQEEQ
jgi:hypothetical protein